MPSKRTNTYRTSSSEETKRLGEEFSKRLSAARRRDEDGAAVVVLSGELGAGKTTFVQGFLRGMGIRRRAPSPTFVIVRRYRAPRAGSGAVRKEGVPQIFHMDAYRLKDASHLAALGFGEMLRDPRNIVLIEWGERIKDAIPRGAARIEFGYDKKEGARKIKITTP